MLFTEEDNQALQHKKTTRELEKMQIKTKTKYKHTLSREGVYIFSSDPKNCWEAAPILSAETEMIKTQGDSFAFPYKWKNAYPIT